jgi:short-subunit dehydrogenase
MDYRTALITGASSGMGRSLARRLARAGTEVVLCARRVPELEALAAEIRSEGGRARVVEMDVADTERTVASIRAVDAEMGGLDLVMANAGIGRAIDARRLRWERISQLCLVNFNGAIATLCAVLPGMVKRGRGHLVGVSSMGALAPFPTIGAYGATKAGLSMFLASMRLDLRGTGVAVTCVHPGFVRTEMTAHVKKPMPLALESDEAADLILTKLRRKPAEINFPVSMTAVARALAALPAPMRDAALLRFPTPDEDADDGV